MNEPKCQTLEAVADFHRAFDIASPERPCLPGLDAPGTKLMLGMFGHRLKRMSVELMDEAKRRGDGPDSVLFLRLQLCVEELGELAEAMSNGDMVEVLDALCDMRYVQDGTTLALGLKRVFLLGFMNVHQSNMSKLDEDGKPVKNEAGRVIKGPRYERPSLGQFLNSEVGDDFDGLQSAAS